MNKLNEGGKGKGEKIGISVGKMRWRWDAVDRDFERINGEKSERDGK